MFPMLLTTSNRARGGTVVLMLCRNAEDAVGVVRLCARAARSPSWPPICHTATLRDDWSRLVTDREPTLRLAWSDTGLNGLQKVCRRA